MNRLQKLGGVAALVEASLYISIFLFFGAYWQYSAEAGVAEKLAYLAEQKVPLYLVYLFGYVVFGAALVVLVLAVHERLKAGSPVLARAASVFGLLWAGLVIAAGMIANVGLLTAVGLAAKDPNRAYSLYATINVVVEGIGGGNEIVGGLWLLLLSIAALGNGFPRALVGLGLLVGTAGVATVVPLESIKEIFGLSQIVWFVWLGVVLLRTR